MIDQKIAEFIEYLPSEDRSRFIDHIPGMGSDQLLGKFYVYVLIRPNGTVFYVRKGCGCRIDDHERDARKGEQSHKCNVIRKIWSEGGQIIKQKVGFFDKEEDDYQLEMLLIAFFGRENLANGTDGGVGTTNCVSIRTGKPNGRPPVSMEGKKSITTTFTFSIDVIEKIDRLKRGNESRKDVIVRLVREVAEDKDE